MSVTSPLPTGWTYTAVSDLCQFNPKTKADDDVACGFASMHGLGTKYRDRLRFEERPWGDVKKAYTHFQDGDVLIAKVTPCFENGKAGIASKLPNGIGAGSSEFCVFRPADGVDNRYLLAWFSTEEFRRRATVAMTGSVGLKRVPKEVFLSEQVPLAPAREQQRIADKLDTVLARVDAVNDRLARAAPMLKRFRQAVLAAATSGRLTADWRAEQIQQDRDAGTPKSIPLTELSEDHEQWLLHLPNSWTLLRATDVVERGSEIVYGIVQPGPKLESGIPYVRGMDIVDGHIQVAQLLRTSAAIAARYARASLRGGDVLLGIIRATKVAIVPDELNGANITQGTARFRPSALLSSRFLAYVLDCPQTQNWLHAHYRGIDMPGLNLADVRQTPVPLPPAREQAEIVRRVDLLLAFANRLEIRLQAAQTAASRLTPSLLAKAFRGELVQQDPNDEPASELLRRLTQSKPVSPAKGRRRQAA